MQGLEYLPATAVAQPQARLKRNLLGREPFGWQDFAHAMAEIWRYGAPAPLAVIDS